MLKHPGVLHTYYKNVLELSKMNVSELQLADLVFVCGSHWLDFPVKLVTQSQYTHVAGYVGMGNLVEAQGLRKTGFEPLETYKGSVDVYRCPRLTVLERQQIMDYVHKEIGGRYDYLLIGWEALKHAFGVVLPYVKNKARICSTLWSDAYKAAGVDLCPKQQYPTPSDLVKSAYLRKIGVV
jgi:uncharacterized protein YycO